MTNTRDTATAHDLANPNGDKTMTNSTHPASLTEIRRTLREAFPGAAVKASKIVHAEDDIDLVSTAGGYAIAKDLCDFVSEAFNFDYIGRRNRCGWPLGEGYQNRYRWEFTLRD